MAGTACNEDAAVLSVPPNMAIVQTVDILTPVVNDPYYFGRIAACNALSDVYAMGGTPWCAMNIACFPQDLADNHQEILRQLLLGGQAALDEAEAVLAGGHTIQDAELKYGLAVTGIIDPNLIAANNHLTPHLALVLTKPLGIGILSTAVKAKWPHAQEETIIKVSGRLNAAGAKAIQTYKLPCATDITGFGLLGHALELAQASNVSLQISAKALPLLPHVLDFAADGLIPAGCYRNRQHCAPHIEVQEDVDQDRLLVAYDPQTSGGLLIAVPKPKLQDVLAFLTEQGDAACVIGEVLQARNDGKHILVTA